MVQGVQANKKKDMVEEWEREEGAEKKGSRRKEERRKQREPSAFTAMNEN